GCGDVDRRSAEAVQEWNHREFLGGRDKRSTGAARVDAVSRALARCTATASCASPSHRHASITAHALLPLRVDPCCEQAMRFPSVCLFVALLCGAVSTHAAVP